MHHKVFASYRRLLFFTVLEAAKNVAITPTRPDGVSERAWNRWEKGESPIPDEVINNLKLLIDERQNQIKHITERLNAGEKVELSIPSSSIDIVDYRLKQSVFAEAVALGAVPTETVK
ncbi:DUF1870 family protein [Neisseria sp.]|uniref:Aca2/YdiL-like domain-containing protein n=1 Tax=Neisseria sp. TaxID=192066 RepID=UPI0035A08C2C